MPSRLSQTLPTPSRTWPPPTTYREPGIRRNLDRATAGNRLSRDHLLVAAPEAMPGRYMNVSSSVSVQPGPTRLVVAAGISSTEASNDLAELPDSPPTSGQASARPCLDWSGGPSGRCGLAVPKG